LAFGAGLLNRRASAAGRFNEKRVLIAVEANCIETSYLRLNLLSQKAQPELQQCLAGMRTLDWKPTASCQTSEAAAVEMARSKEIQRDIWTKAVAATQLRDTHADAGKLLLPSLNSMIDITATRRMALQTHPPNVIYALLFSLGLICAMLAGYRMSNGQRRSRLHILSFAVMPVIIVYVIIDVEYPRAGLIRLQAFDQLLVDVRAGMN
jgi:hypothetical protein